MRSDRRLLLVWIVFVLLAGCGGGGGGGSDTFNNNPGGVETVPEGANVLSVSVNGSLCSQSAFINKPCVKITLCSVGTTNCQTITDILLDTGTSGLRIFRRALNGLPLGQVIVNNTEFLAECIQYADSSSHWGPVQMASIRMGDEPPVQLPIHVIDATFGALPSACANADRSPADSGFNGILGVGYFLQDCGVSCTTDKLWYYSCNGSTCSQTAVPLESQVQNPVALLPMDNNGLYVRFPAVPTTGSTSVDGYLVLGIGTRTNNTPAGVHTYPVDDYGDFITIFGGNSYMSFADTGSNGLFFGSPPASLPDCSGPYSFWYCPTSTKSFTATVKGVSGSQSGAVSFEIGNFVDLMASGNSVFRNIGGNDTPGSFDWGLPFFLGRTVYVGIEGKSSSLGTGPYIAY